jgi:hypothetical protein
MDCDMADYRELMTKLATAQARYAAERLDAQRRYEVQCAAAAATAAQAKAAAVATSAGVRAAAAIVEHVDLEAAQVWQKLRSQAPGRLRKRLGIPPEPAAPDEVVEPPPVDEPEEGPPEPAAVRHLAAAGSVLASGRRREAFSGGAYALLPLLGAIAAALAYGLARGLLLFGHSLHGPAGVVVTAVGQIATFASPLAGLPATKGYADRRGARIDAGAIGMVVLGGMLAVCGLNFLR